MQIDSGPKEFLRSYEVAQLKDVTDGSAFHEKGNKRFDAGALALKSSPEHTTAIGQKLTPPEQRRRIL